MLVTGVVKSMTKPAAQRWWASETAKDNHGKRNKNEQKLEAAYDTIRAKNDEIAQLKAGIAA